MTLVENLVIGALVVFSLALTVIAARVYFFARNTKILWIAAGFALFLLKGLTLSVALFTRPDWRTEFFVPALIFDLVILLVFYAAVLKRSR